jgi:DNA-binding CsgD family transcriptional regulator/type II secretory pathway predicted ATPase ExeA
MLAGRDEEIQALDALFHDCAAGRGLVAVIRGPVASGKTTLLRALAERAVAAGAIFLSAVASRAERGLQLGVLDQLFRDSQLPAAVTSRVAELLESHAPADERAEPEPGTVSPALARVFDGLLEVLADLSQQRPLVIAVDDMQCADVATLHFLSYLARRAGTSPILTVLTECAGTLPTHRQLHAEMLRQGNCRCVTLAPLSPANVARLLAEHVGTETARHLASACHAMTGGNPLLVNALREDSRISAGGSPAELAPGPAFRSAVVTCLHRYEPDTAELGQAVAVLGEDGTLNLLAEMLAVSPESAGQGIDALTTSGLLESGRFRHEQARQAVLSQMTADERATMHGSAARTLYRTGAPPATLARHLVAAHRIGTRWAVAALQEAADQALADGEAGLAIDYLRRAERECVDDRQCAAIRFSLARAEWPIDPECAARHLPDLVTDARTGKLGVDCLGELAYYLLWAGDTGSAAEILAALDLGSVNAAPRPGFASQHPALWSPREFLYPDLVARARRKVRDAKASAPAAARPQPPPALVPVPAMKNGEAAVTGAERILAERGLNDPTLASITTALMTLICEDMLDRAASWCSQLLQESDVPDGNPLWHAVLTALSAMIETRLGNLPTAQAYAQTALNSLTRKAWGVAVGGPLSSLVLAASASSKHEDAAGCLRTPVPEAMFGTIYGLLYLSARGEYFLATGRPQSALADFTDCGNRMSRWGLDLPGLVPWRIKAAEAQLALGDNLQARELSRAQLAQARTRFPRTRGISLRVLAMTSHPTKRIALLRESAEVLRDAGARLELAHTFTELSNAHLALGEHGRAQWAARQARNLAERCGAQAPQTAFGKMDPDKRKPGDGVDSGLLTQLSDAEQRVAMLAAYGYTNGQIAHKLFITVSTVEQHLTRVYRKLGVAGRSELPIEV